MKITDSDLKQILLMKNNIHHYEKIKHDLDSLLALTRSIEESLENLQNVDDKWKETFRTEWWELELLSSVMLY